MTRIGRSRKFLFLLNFLIAIVAGSLSNSALATQNLPGAAIQNANGQDVTMTAQAVGAEATLNVLSGTDIALLGVSSISTAPAANLGTANFLGNSTVAGQIGTAVLPLHFVTSGGAGTTVTFNGGVNSQFIQFNSASTMIFNGLANNGAVGFQAFQGTVILGSGALFTGAATNGAANTGNITLNSASTYNGAIGVPGSGINQINLIGNARIVGQTVAQNYVVGPNTLTNTGVVIFPAGAKLTTRVLSDTAFGRINAGANGITFTPGLQVNVLIDNTVVLSGVPLKVVTGTGGGGAPITTTSNNVRFSFRGVNPAGSGNVFLYPSVVPATLPAGAGGAAAAAFDAGLFGATGDFLAVQQAVNALNNLAAIGAAQAQFAPIVNGGNAAMSFEAFNQFQNFWQSNVSKARSSNMCYQCASACDTPCLAPCGSNCARRQLRRGETTWDGEGLWIDGFGYTGDQKTRMNIAGYDVRMYGAMLGVERPISEHWQLGVGGGYANTDIHGEGTQKNGSKIDTPEATLYLGYTKGSWFLDNFLTFAWNHYKDYRRIQFPGLDRTARGSYNGQEYGALVAGGYNYFTRSGFTITPLASMQLINLRIEGYTETGAGSLNLIQKSQHYEIIQSGLGLMLGYPTAELACGNIFTEMHAKWLYDIEDYRISNTSRFSGGGPAFTTLGVSPARSQLNAGVSSTLFATGNLSLKVSYEFNYRHDYAAHQGRLSVGYVF